MPKYNLLYLSAPISWTEWDEPKLVNIANKERAVEMARAKSQLIEDVTWGVFEDDAIEPIAVVINGTVFYSEDIASEDAPEELSALGKELVDPQFAGMSVPPEAFVPNGAEIEQRNFERMFQPATRVHFVNSESGDWSVLYINGKLADEGHSISSRHLIDALTKAGVKIERTSEEQPEEWFEGQRPFLYEYKA